MSKFVAKKVINESIEDVFRAFIQVNKREFRKFSAKNPIGSKCTKILKQSGKNTLQMTMEVTDYEFEGLYQVTGRLNEDEYISTFKFIKEEVDRTRIELIEEQKIKSLGSKIGLLIGGIFGNKKAKQKLNRVVEGIQQEIEIYNRKVKR